MYLYYESHVVCIDVIGNVTSYCVCVCVCVNCDSGDGDDGGGGAVAAWRRSLLDGNILSTGNITKAEREENKIIKDRRKSATQRKYPWPIKLNSTNVYVFFCACIFFSFSVDSRARSQISLSLSFNHSIASISILSIAQPQFVRTNVWTHKHFHQSWRILRVYNFCCCCVFSYFLFLSSYEHCQKPKTHKNKTYFGCEWKEIKRKRVPRSKVNERRAE